MVFLINTQLPVVSYHWCLKHIVLVYTGASSHVPSLLFLTAWTAMSLAALAHTTAFSNALITLSALHTQ